jgi:hypothetical protein
MNRRLVLSMSALALVAPGAAYAQSARPTAIEVTPYAGYMMFGKYLQGPLGTSITSANSPVYGGQLGIALGGNLSLIGNVAYSSSNLEVGVPFLGGLSVGDTKVLLYDAGLQYQLPLSGAAGGLTPFVQAGAGAMRFDVKVANVVETQATNVAFNFGGGIDYQISPALGIRVMAKDYVGKFDFKDATRLSLDGSTAHNVALSVGVKLGFQ